MDQARGLQKPHTAPWLWPQTPQKIRSADGAEPDPTTRQSLAPLAGQAPPSFEGPLARSWCLIRVKTPGGGKRGRRRARHQLSALIAEPDRRRAGGISVVRCERNPGSVTDLRRVPCPVGATYHGRPGAGGNTPPTADRSGPRICAGSDPSSLVPATRFGDASRQCEIHRKPSASRRIPACSPSWDVMTRIGVPASTRRSCHSPLPWTTSDSGRLRERPSDRAAVP